MELAYNLKQGMKNNQQSIKILEWCDRHKALPNVHAQQLEGSMTMGCGHTSM